MLDYEVIELETRHTFRVARAGSPAARRSVWVRLRDGDGFEGWGEAAPLPYYGETVETVAAVLPRYAEILAGALDDREGPGLDGSDREGRDREGVASSGERDGGGWFELERLERALVSEVGGNPSARAAISAALHDLLGKRLGQPVWRLWGLSPESAPVSSFTLGLDEPEVMRQKVREAASYPVLKVKVGTERDEEVLALIREEAPEKGLRVDANTAWTGAEAVARLPMLEAYGVELLEQPVAAGDVEGLRRVRSRSRVPVVADESCTTSSTIPALVGAVDGINIKLSKCGSLREAVRMVHAARAHGLSVMLGCMIESTLGIAAAIQLAPLVDWVDLDGAALLARDPFEGPGLEPDGRLRFNEEPGLGGRRARRG